MVADPSATAVTSPEDETVATPVLDDDQSTVNSATELPPASVAVAVIASASPMTPNATELWENSRVAGSWATVAVAVAVIEPMVAVMVAVPLVTEVTVPEDETVATDAADVAHDTLAPLIVAPFWSLTVAVSGCVAPIDEKLKLVAESVIDVATGVGVGVGVVGVLSPPHAASSSTAESRKCRILPRCGLLT
jgi:hypothetical protein